MYMNDLMIHGPVETYETWQNVMEGGGCSR